MGRDGRRREGEGVEDREEEEERKGGRREKEGVQRGKGTGGEGGGQKRTDRVSPTRRDGRPDFETEVEEVGLGGAVSVCVCKRGPNHDRRDFRWVEPFLLGAQKPGAPETRTRHFFLLTKAN